MNKRKSIEAMREFAKEQGGKCLSNGYINNKTNLKWKCKNGHVWHASAGNVINNGTWCSLCSGRNILTIEKMREVAQARGGKCLSNEYVNSDIKLLWVCKVGHKWEASANVIVHAKHWCPECAGVKKRTIDEMKLFALGKGGLCLSEKYTNRKTKLLWQCSQGHQWRALHGYLIRSDAWCPKCSKKAKPTLRELQELAKERGGKFLSLEYINNATKVKWQCADGHIFAMQQANVKIGQWCPECSNPYRTEGKCRHIMEFLLETEFVKTRQVLGNGLELDGYSEEYKLAFEYDGRQHREPIKFFGGDVKRFARQQQRDVLKNRLCKAKGVKLLRIPDFANQTKGGLVGWIVKGLQNLNVDIKGNPKKITFEGLIKNSSVIKTLNKLAESRGGKLISKEYNNSYGKLIWECKEGHRWEAMANNVKKKSWCPKCSGLEKGTIGEMRKIANERGGKCLSNKYVNSATKLLWECKDGHQWRAVPHNIKTKSWCPICSRKIRGETFKRNAEAKTKKK